MADLIERPLCWLELEALGPTSSIIWTWGEQSDPRETLSHLEVLKVGLVSNIVLYAEAHNSSK